MSRGNLETIARLLRRVLSKPERLFDRGILRFFDPGVEVRQSVSMMGTEGTFHGYDGLARSARESFETFRGLHSLPTRLIDGGDRVVGTVEARASGRQSGVELDQTVAHVWTRRDGRIVAWHVYFDTSPEPRRRPADGVGRAPADVGLRA